MNNWQHKEKIITCLEDFPPTCVGFIYLICNKQTGKKYIGKKILQNTTNTKIPKKLLKTITGAGRKPVKQRIVKESNWNSYYGSSKDLLTDVKILGVDEFSREILRFCSSKRSLSYYEVKEQMLNEVLEYPEKWYNKNILNRYFSGNLD